MKSLVIVWFSVLIAVARVEAQDSTPESSPIPGLAPGKIEEPTLPTPDAGPEDAGPTLLPESDELPVNPRAEQPTRASKDQASIKSSVSERNHFEEVQSMAMRSPRAAYLLKRARKSSSAAARRAYLRAYYSTVAARMRKLDPKLKSSIDAYEEANVHQVAGSASQSNGSSHRSHLHRTAAREVHHRSRRVTARHRYERMTIIYDPYGIPYGPPMVFYPW
jgi:hypothetical protein